MIKGNLMNNTKTRRKGSMLQDSLSKIKYLLVLAFLLVLPMQAMAGMGVVPVIDQTDTGVERLVSFFDTRGRDTFVQVTNTSSEKVNIHVQVYDVASIFTECEECNFDDMLTGHDTHVYDVENMMTNAVPGMASEAVCTELGPDTYGFVVISLLPQLSEQSAGLIGMFRIIDESGYEYRANSAGSEENFIADTSVDQIVNFSDANGHNLSDLVGITYVDLGPGDVHAHPGIATTFGSPQDQILILDQDEDPISCSPTTFACAVGALDKGIDNALPNSKGQLNRVCASSILNSNIAGFLDLPFNGFTCSAASGVGNPDGSCSSEPYFVGFIGLNNGDGTGSMDSWWERGRHNVDRNLEN